MRDTFDTQAIRDTYRKEREHLDRLVQHAQGNVNLLARQVEAASKLLASATSALQVLQERREELANDIAREFRTLE